MGRKKRIIIVGILLIALIVISAFCFFIPTISINLKGRQYQTLVIGEEYIEEGANAYFKKIFSKEKLNLKITGNVDTSKIGKYIITYQAETNGIKKEAIRIIKVEDNINPTIVLNEEVKVCKKNNLIEIAVKANDNYDGDLSDKVKYRINKDKIFLTVIDSSNNKTELTKNVKYIDEEKPMLTLTGSPVIYLKVGEKYNDLGAKAYDSCDGNITDNIETEGTVNTNLPGAYQIFYKVKDSVGKETKMYRTVIVRPIDEPILNPIIKGATIYLTFDDGPGPYTNQILEVLNKYNVKATFFVTNQFPNYQHLIKDEYENGHAIGIHTYSHKWSIYESVDTYLADYKKIEDIVYNEIGIRPKIFRFPGGSSNTVSKNYSKGIMTKLTKLMTDNGYIYFDWTFDSGDTNKKDNSTKAIINNFKNNLKGDGNYVVLMHDIKKNTLEALPQIIEYAQSLGYTFSALDENSPTEHFKIVN